MKSRKHARPSLARRTFRADVRDTKLDPAAALSAMQALRTVGVQVVIGPQSSAELAAVKPFVDANPSWW